MMKTNRFCIHLLLVLMTGLLAFSACAGPITYDRKVETVPVVVPEVSITNDDGSVTVTPEHVVDKEIVYMIPRASDDVVTSLQAVKAVNELNPTPTAPFVNLAVNGLMGAFTLASGIFAAVNRRKAIKAVQAGSDHLNVLGTVIDAIESSASKNVKDSIRNLAVSNGTHKLLHTLVKSRT